MGKPLNSQFLKVVVHDLRNPLNVIGLSLRMIEQAVPEGDPELLDDLKMVRENVGQLNRMLMHLSEYYRLYQDSVPLSVTSIDPKWLLTELVEEQATRASRAGAPVRLEVLEGSPLEVSWDQARARMAIQHALVNATTAADGAPVLIRLGGGPDRCIVEVHVEAPCPSSVKPMVLRPDRFERLLGTAAERTSLELAIAARISELFGGTARLDVDPKGTTIVFDWPARLSPAGG